MATVSRIRTALSILALVVPGQHALAQQQSQSFPVPRLATLTPSGGRVGTTVEMTLSGSDLDEITALHFSHPGLTATRLDPPAKVDKPNAQPERRRNQMGAPPVPSARFRVNVAADAPLGIHEVRAAGKWGISNPRAFVVGSWPEVLEKEPNNDVDQAQRVELNSTVNGKIDPNIDVDYYLFAGNKGQRVVVHCASSSIDSRLQPLVQMYTTSGQLLAANRHYRDRDAVLDAELPETGNYLVRLGEFTHLSGGPEFFYRLTITTAPWIDAIYPPAVEPGKTTAVTLYGRNLPGGKPDPQALLDGRPLDVLTVDITPPKGDSGLSFTDWLPARSGTVDGFEYRWRGEKGPSNPVLMAFAQAPVILDNGDNDTPEKAQEVVVPCELCGRIEKRHDRDWYAFNAKKGEVFTIDGFADRLGAPLDLYFLLRGRDGQILGEFDDHPDVPTNSGKFFTRTEDAKTRFVVPADGRYELMVSSRTADLLAGPRHIYRVSLQREKPDFHLVVVSGDETGAVRQGGAQEMQVVCWRQGNFTGSVTLTAAGLPAGVTCGLQTVGPTQREALLVVTAAADAPLAASEIKITGTAEIDGVKITHAARPGCLVWPMSQQQQQNNGTAISRLAHSLWLAVRPQGPFSLSVAENEIAVPSGGNVAIKVKVNRQWADFKAPVQLARASVPPQQNGQMINVPNVTVAANQTDGEIKFQLPSTTPQGTYNLVFQGTAQFPFARDPKASQKPNTQFVQVSPPIRLTIFSSFADLNLPKSSLALAAGGEAPLAVAVKRLHGYKGPLSVQLVVPQGDRGVSAAPVTLAADQDEVKLIVKAKAGARPGAIADAVVRATAVGDKLGLAQEAKLSLTVTSDKPGANDQALSSGGYRTANLLAESSDGWKFLPSAKVKGDRWKQLKFDDAGWQAGKAPIGYGEDEIATRRGTLIKEEGVPFVFRRIIDVPAELLERKGVTFRMTVASDDSATVYLNGELADDDPELDHEFKYWNREIDLAARQLRPGKNIVAVLVRNRAGSSDLYLDLAITAQVPMAKGDKKK
jgi:hypothetical protein